MGWFVLMLLVVLAGCSEACANQPAPIDFAEPVTDEAGWNAAERPDCYDAENTVSEVR